MTDAVHATAWQRLHPLTPILGGGKFLLIMAGLVGQQGLRQDSGFDPGVIGLIVLAATGVAVLFGYVGWRRTGYRLTETELQVDSGVLTRRSRRVPLARLQSVEVVRPIIGRVLGMAELRLEVVGGGKSEAPLAYLSEEDAQALRTRMLAFSAGAETAATTPETRVLVTVPSGVLVASILLNIPVLLLGALLVGLVLVAVIEPSAALPAALAVVSLAFPLASAVVKRFFTEYGFTVAESDGGLRLSRGLLDTRASSIPDGRVQAIRVIEPILWRSRGWVRVEVDVAGYAEGGQQASASSALLPVAPRSLAEALVGRVLGGGLPVPTAGVPAQARWRAPLSHRRLRIGLDSRHLVTTYGVVATTTDIVPLAKVQSLRLTSGPWQRKLGLASLHADSAGRRLNGGVARHRDAAEARALLDELSARTRAARAA